MRIDRRDLLKAGIAISAVAALPRMGQAQAAFAPKPSGWRNFEILTKVEIAKPQGKVQVWVPVPSVNQGDWFKSGESKWTTNAKAVSLKKDPKYQAAFVHAEWDASEKAPVLEVTSRFSAQDRAVDLSKPGKAAPLSQAERKLYTESTALIPTDGIVRQFADKITVGATTDLEKARKIYDWVVENSSRNPKTRGCGIGDVAAMLKSGDLTGKCADLNALYVGLARAAGLPARDVYGLRVAPSKFGYKSLGAGSNNVTKAQHCRAEVYLAGHGWIAVDPADVRKVVLEEPPANLALNDPKVVAARAALFGSWEGNWLAYNFAHDINLPGASGKMLEFLMYPQAETVAERLDCLDPDGFRYTITSRELSA
ncbi:MAG: transglutaminase-like domain-containing protein [Pseudorhodoplanes sp.]|jgi:transglutaminase-like putative cysteine protease|nr:transglutaminase-like domain-containing protein [Pseudorhodoplanes sp.]